MTYALFAALYLAGAAVIFRLLDYWRRHQPHALVPTQLILMLSILWFLMAIALISNDLWQYAGRLYQRIAARHPETSRGQHH